MVLTALSGRSHGTRALRFEAGGLRGASIPLRSHRALRLRLLWGSNMLRSPTKPLTDRRRNCFTDRTTSQRPNQKRKALASGQQVDHCSRSQTDPLCSRFLRRAGRPCPAELIDRRPLIRTKLVDRAVEKRIGGLLVRISEKTKDQLERLKGFSRSLYQFLEGLFLRGAPRKSNRSEGSHMSHKVQASLWRSRSST